MIEPRLGQLTRDEWLEVGRVMFRWPAPEVCSPAMAQELQLMVNERIARLDAGESDVGEGEGPACLPDQPAGGDEKDPRPHERTPNMSIDLARVRARESAADDWISTREAADGVSYDGSTLDRLLREGFLTGAEWGEGEADARWAVDQATGQQQLDDAGALIREAAELLRGFEKDHRDKVEALAGQGLPIGDDRQAAVDRQCQLISDTIARAERNALMASRLEAWLRGEDRYPVTLDQPGVVSQAESVRRAKAELDEAFAPRPPVGVALLTGDPRFDPAGAVTVNGYLFHPTERT